MEEKTEKFVFEMDILHFRLLLAIGALLLGFMGAVDGWAFWERRRNAQLRERVSALEGKMAAVLESLQHSGE